MGEAPLTVPGAIGARSRPTPGLNVLDLAEDKEAKALRDMHPETCARAWPSQLHGEPLVMKRFKGQWQSWSIDWVRCRRPLRRIRYGSAIAARLSSHVSMACPGRILKPVVTLHMCEHRVAVWGC